MNYKRTQRTYTLSTLAHLEAFSGSSLRVDSALHATKPPKPTGMIGASEPPTTIMSQSPAKE